MHRPNKGDQIKMSVVIITDSTCDLSLVEAKSLGVEVASLKVNFGAQEYLDKVTITNEEFYEKLKSCKELPKTTLVTPQTFMELFNKYPDQPIVGIFLASALSGTYQSAVIAKTELERDDIFIVDSGSASLGLFTLVERAVKLRDEGYDAQSIYEIISSLKERLRIIAAVDTLEYLIKGGRLPAAAGIVGSILNIKPLMLVDNGTIKPIGKSRGMKNAIKELHKIYESYNPDKEINPVFAHSGNEAYLHSAMSEFGASDITRTITIGSVVGAHVGPGAIAISFFVNE